MRELYWGGGIASECLCAYLDHVTARLQALEIVAGVEKDKATSARLMQKLGFVYGGQGIAEVCTYRL